ncbi:MAG: hypothetical protein HGA76_06675 [Candidatus Firestonebacteria bacterium]|nr:hypothetical protein [Candidatus Firestonebacteria bacterium]
MQFSFKCLRWMGLAGFSVAFFLLSAQAKDFPDPNVLMILPTGAFSNSFILEYERGLGNYFGFALRGTSTHHWLWEGGKTGSNDDYDWIYTLDGTGFGLSARLYPSGNAPQGYFIGPRVDFLNYRGTYEDRVKNLPPVDVTLQVTTYHLETGYQFIFGEHFVLTPFVDAGVPVVKSSNGGATLAGIVTFILGGGIYLGWAF